MQFNTKDIQISKACKEFTITLKHTGTQPKTSMGHNIVIGKAEDMDGISKMALAQLTLTTLNLMMHALLPTPN